MSIENVDLFDGLMPEEIQLLRDTSVVREFAKNTVLIHEGDVADSLYVVESGRVKVYCSDKGGKDFVLNILEHGDYFGELALLDDDGEAFLLKLLLSLLALAQVLAPVLGLFLSVLVF